MEQFDGWDQVDECSLHVSSGRIVVAGCTDYFPDAARVVVPPSSYRVRLYYGNLDAPEGRDVYRVALWPEDVSVAARLIKRRKTEDKSN